MTMAQLVSPGRAAALSRQTLSYVVPFAVVAGLWQLASQFFPPFLFPSLVDVSRRCIEILLNWNQLADVLATVARILAGLAGAFVIGTALAFLMARSRSVSGFLSPILTLFQGVPALSWVVFAIRTPRAGSESLMKDVRQAIWSVDANLPLSDVRTQEYYYAASIARTSFTLVMLAIAASIALLLGVVGLYGVIAYTASQRRREIGIRIALGAQRHTITTMFVRQGLLLAGTGVACGLVVALAATRLLRSLLFHTSPMDPLTYAAASLALCGAAALASYIPSRRTASVNPVEALRAE